ncbi:MAG: TonB-dependent receptor [Chitinophagaceae bacterium]|nr:MAG: TonB-dependent receptor [Chitinophagaceae bacterium]
MRVTKLVSSLLNGLVLLLLVAVPVLATAQDYRIQLLVTDDGMNNLSHANISIGEQKFVADSNGRAVIYLSKGRYQVVTSSVGHHGSIFNAYINNDTIIKIILHQRQSMLGNVVVTASQRLHRAQMSSQVLGIAQIRKLPVILGETDPMKTITLLPGIKNGGEASAGIYVRGGGPDQNLVLLDGIPVYNPNHLLGFFSVFNGEAIKSVEVIKGGIPAEYGGRLSSVIAVESRDGDKDSLKVTGGLGLIASRIAIEAPIIKGKSSIMISGRRTYIDQVGKLIAKDRIGDNGYYFYDLNGKIDYILNKNNSLNLTFYTGQDRFNYLDHDKEGTRSFKADWGNRLAGLTWKQQINSKLKQQLTVVYNKFDLNSRFGFSTNNVLFASGLHDYQVKNDWGFNANKWLRLKGGLQYTWHRFNPGAGGLAAGEQNFDSKINNQYAREAAAYLSADVDITDKLNIVAGLRYSYFSQVGPTENVIYQDDGLPSGETEVFGKGDRIARYHFPEPRLNLLYKLSSTSGVKLSYTRTIQYLHLATTSAATFPSDLWIPSSRRVQPAQAQQVAGGYYVDLFGRKIEVSVEAYYKEMSNQIEFKPGAQLLLNQNLENEMIFGKGKAYGIELLVQKKYGRLTGWVGYTLSRTERKFAEINDGRSFPYRYDRTHDLSIVASYKINKHWEGSAVFVYGTGNAITMPTGRYTYNMGYNRIDGHYIFTTIDQYSKINDYRMPAYHRMDLAFVYTHRPEKTKGLRSSWNFSIYNIYNRANPYFIYLDIERVEKQIKGKKVYLFPVLPSVTWNFKFG